MNGTTPPGWYADGYGGLRWWDGVQWTPHYAVQSGTTTGVGFVPPHAETSRRVLAYLIDAAVSAPLLIVGFFTFFDAAMTSSPNQDSNSVPWGVVVYLLGIALMAVVSLVNRVIVQGRTGRSLGKRIMKLRLVRIANGRPAGIGWCLLREVLAGMAGIVDIVLVFVTDHGQRVGDMAAKTIVMNEEDVEGWFGARSSHVTAGSVPSA